MNQIILASASPRRAELLDQIGVYYQIQAVDINESQKEGESADVLVQRLAIEKAETIKYSDYPVLGADTLGVIQDQLLVKPTNFEHAKSMLMHMSGQWHEILSAVALSYNGETHVRLNRNRVLFRPIDTAEIEQYWQTGEPQDKAGAYAIQGLAAKFIQRIEGSYSGIMGLPLFETYELLESAGIKPVAIK